RHAKAPRAERAPQAARDVEAVQLEDGARVRRPPVDLLAQGVPGEDAAAVRLEQPPRAEVAADRHQPDCVRALGVKQAGVKLPEPEHKVAWMMLWDVATRTSVQRSRRGGAGDRAGPPDAVRTCAA